MGRSTERRIGATSESRTNSTRAYRVAPGLSGLIERDQEIASLERIIDETADGTGRLVSIEGVAGIGKTALLTCAAEYAQRKGLNILTARGIQLERDYGFGVVTQLFSPHVFTPKGVLRQDCFEGAALVAAPVFEHGDQPATGAASRHQILHGLYWLTHRLSEPNPGQVLLVDDIQWADEESLGFIRYLAERIEGTPSTVILAVRTDEALSNRAYGSLHLPKPDVVLGLTELGPAGVAAFVATVFPDAEAAVVETCERLTSGNPFLLRELLYSLRADGIPPDEATVAGYVPASVLRLVIDRLTRLPPESSALAGSVAVLGSHATLARSAAVAGLDPATATGATEDLAGAQLLSEGEPLRFVHPLITSAVLADISDLESSRLHRRAADVLYREQSTEAAAAHLLSVLPCGDEAVIAMLSRASQDAMSRNHTAPAERYLARALAEIPDRRPAELEVQLAVAQCANGVPDATRYLLQSLDGLSDHAVGVSAVRTAGRFLRQSGRVLEAAALAGRTLELLQPDDPATPELLADYMAASSLDRSLTALPIAHFSRVMEDSLAGDPPSDACMRAQMAAALAVSGSPASLVQPLAESALDDLLGQAQAGHPVNELTVGFGLASLLYVDALNPAVELANQAVELASRRGDALMYALSCVYRCEANHQLGFIAEAIADGETTLRLAAEGRWSWYPTGAPFLAHCLMDRGDDGGAETLLDAAISVQPGSLNQALAMEAQGRLQTIGGDHEAAMETLAAAGRVLTEGYGIDPPSLLAWRSRAALAAWALGKTGQAQDLAGEEEELARRVGTPRPVAVALRRRGMVTTGPAGVELLEESLAVLEDSPAVLERTRCRVELGAALRRGGWRVAARGHLAAGLESASALGARALAERARSELLASGARPRRAALSGSDSLTPSELRIATMASAGLSNTEIAQSLFLTKRTVEWHMGRVYRKLDVSNRAGLAAALAGPTPPGAGSPGSGIG